MSQQRLLCIDIEAKSSNTSSLWTRSDNSFRFDFFTDNPPPAHQEGISPSGTETGRDQRIAFTGQGSNFAFNFQIPPATPIEDMETTETAHRQQCVEEETSSVLQESASESKAKKKKKKSGKKNTSSPEPQQQPTEGSEEGKDTELSAEEQLSRQLDWCIEQLELGLSTQKGTPKQKEEASRALKTLRSSKAPLAKKRQLMRAMTGDYRKKMEEEKSKQFKLIQGEIASAHVKVVADSPKKSVFHRRADTKAKMPAAEEIAQQSESQDTEHTAQTQDKTSSFVFNPSKEEFHFNFL